MTKSKALTPIEEVRGNLTKMESQFKKVLPKGTSPEKFTRIIFTAIQKMPGLLTCDRQSFYGACMFAAQDGLLPDGREGVIIPYKGQATWLPMIGGVLKKIRNSGELLSLSSHVVYSGDEFSYWIDTEGEHIEHQPLLIGDRGDATHVYAIARVKSGGVYAEVMSMEQVEKVKSKSPSKDSSSSPWKNWPDEMMRKTVIRRLSKKLPMSNDLAEVLHRDDAFYNLDEKEVKENKPEKTKSSRLSKIVEECENPEEVVITKEAMEQTEVNQETFEKFK